MLYSYRLQEPVSCAPGNRSGVKEGGRGTDVPVPFPAVGGMSEVNQQARRIFVSGETFDHRGGGAETQKLWGKGKEKILLQSTGGGLQNKEKVPALEGIRKGANTHKKGGGSTTAKRSEQICGEKGSTESEVKGGKRG